jgi:ubiquinone/menaquinone biosynthesis C-methylase UbiE
MSSRHCRGVLAVALATALLFTSGIASAQQRHPVSGRTIANVMSHQAAVWLDRPEREREEAPREAIKALAIKRGASIADVGAGSGYYTVLLARAVGERGRVYATDIQPEMLELTRRKVAREQLSNVEVILGSEDDPRLPAGAIDLILMVDVYHELARPQAMLRALKRVLRPGGRLVLIEFRKESRDVPIREEHKMSVTEARTELEAEGYKFDKVIDVLPWQHILVFRP